MASALNCTSDKDCLSLLKVCDETQGRFFSLCDCSPKFGWKGEDCDDASGALIFNRTAAVILVLTGIPLLFFTGWLFSVYVRKYKKNKSTALGRSVTLLGTVIIADLFLMTEFSFDLITYFKPTSFVSKDNDIEPKFQDQRDLVSLSAILLILFVGAQNIVVWLSYICELAVYFPEQTVIKGTQMRIGTFVIFLILTVAKISLFSLGLIDLWQNLLTVVAGIGAIVYTIGYFYLMKYFQTLTKSLDNVNISQLFALISFTYRVNLCAILVLCVASVIIVVFGEENEETLEAGQFNFSILLLFVANICLYTLIGSVPHYFYHSQPWKKKTVIENTKISSTVMQDFSKS